MRHAVRDHVLASCTFKKYDLCLVSGVIHSVGYVHRNTRVGQRMCFCCMPGRLVLDVHLPDMQDSMIVLVCSWRGDHAALTYSTSDLHVHCIHLYY